MSVICQLTAQSNKELSFLKLYDFNNLATVNIVTNKTTFRLNPNFTNATLDVTLLVKDILLLQTVLQKEDFICGTYIFASFSY